MNEQEQNAFRLVYGFTSKWRETVIETDEQWDQFAKDVGEICAGNHENKLLWLLMTAALDYFSDLYRNGMKPLPADYFGRDDL